ncbi:MAG: BREX-1 system adenine-specific DNA-methyltransferase PglX, partial [Bacteroidales bacterium]|nr:BREX-1 system adenine-specific DNA-methyltransferase PglX [Bacteroidales bacterium]
MDTSRLRRFATDARKVLMQGVAQRLGAVGFGQDGSFVEEPVLYEGGAAFMGGTMSEASYHQWKSLQRTIETKSVKSVVEEAAYTWFNRLTAIRILSKNGLVSNVLEFEAADIRVPAIVREARQGRCPQMDAETSEKLRELLQDDSRTSEQFRLLIVEFCHSNAIINNCFGRIADWTELLLPQNILAGGGFVDMLNHTEFISEDDWRSPELIGWLYQFYISERKDEVFAKKGKVEADEIPAATQIFTPNWIVKYMVQNTVGRIYLDNNPSEADKFKPRWQYLVEQSEPTPSEAVYRCDDLTKLKLADLACGSGHILNEFFDLLYDLYLQEGYSFADAVENIFTHNIIGIDIDSRAKQLATFALLLKACQKDRSFANAQCMPRIYDMPQPYEDKSGLGRVLRKFIQVQDERAVGELYSAIKLMDNADSLGSIMKFNISERTRNIIAARMEEWTEADDIPEEVRGLFPYMNIILALTDKYSALVMNPPYMGSGNMNPILGDYVKNNYTDGKSDLFSTFMLLATERLADNGKYGMITMQSWMFLSSFERMRKDLLDNYHVENMLHLGPRTFDELSGEIVQNTAFVIGKNKFGNGTYFRLVDGKDCADKERMFLSGEGCYPDISQQNFEKIPGCP